MLRDEGVGGRAQNAQRRQWVGGGRYRQKGNQGSKEDMVEIWEKRGNEARGNNAKVITKDAWCSGPAEQRKRGFLLLLPFLSLLLG